MMCSHPRARAIGLLLAGDCADHRDAEQFRPLGDDEADSARCRVEQYGVAGLQRVDPAGAEVGVGEVESDGDVTDAHLAGARGADVGGLPPQDVGATGCVEANDVCHDLLRSLGVGWRRS